SCVIIVVFFFQADDGIRYFHVTGVQTCALPISAIDVKGSQGVVPATGGSWDRQAPASPRRATSATSSTTAAWVWGPSIPMATLKIGRTSCRERVTSTGVGAARG